MLVGDTAGLVLNNGVHLEGTNMAVESGYHAGKAVVEALNSIPAGPATATADSGEAVSADGGVVVSRAHLQSYPEALEESFVVKNLEHYEWLIHRVVEDKQLMFDDLPEALADAASEYFKMDRQPKAEHGARAKQRVMQTVGGIRGAIKLGWKYRNIIR